MEKGKLKIVLYPNIFLCPFFQCIVTIKVWDMHDRRNLLWERPITPHSIKNGSIVEGIFGVLLNFGRNIIIPVYFFVLLYFLIFQGMLV